MNFNEEVEHFLKMNFIDFQNDIFKNKLYIPKNQLIINLINISEYIENNNNSEIIEFKDNIVYSEQTINSINLFEDVWKKNKEICQSRILALLGKSFKIPARLTKVRRIDKVIVTKFLEKNHLQGSTNAKFKYGLFLPKQYFRVLPTDITLENQEELLVAVASFSSAKKFNRDNEIYRSFELIRFANLLHFTVIGGLDKLLKNFIKEQKPDDIMTYADYDWSNGKSYEKLGFERLEIISPQEFLINLQTFERTLITKFSEDDLTKNLSTSNYIKIKNSGSIKFLLKLK